MSTQSPNPTATPKALQDCHALLIWMVPHIDKFPRTRRYSLGTHIEEGLMFVPRS